MLSEVHPILLIYLRKDTKHFISNGCLSLQHNIPFPVLIWYPKPDILCEIWELTSVKMVWCEPQGACKCCQVLIWSKCVSTEGYWPFPRQCMPLLKAYQPIWFTKRRRHRIWHFVSILVVNLCGNGTAWTIRGLQMLPEATPTFLMHLRMIMNYVSSNGCLPS